MIWNPNHYWEETQQWEVTSMTRENGSQWLLQVGEPTHRNLIAGSQPTLARCCSSCFDAVATQVRQREGEPRRCRSDLWGRDLHKNHETCARLNFRWAANAKKEEEVTRTEVGYAGKLDVGQVFSKLLAVVVLRKQVGNLFISRTFSFGEKLQHNEHVSSAAPIIARALREIKTCNKTTLCLPPRFCWAGRWAHFAEPTTLTWLRASCSSQEVSGNKFQSLQNIFLCAWRSC